MLNILIAMLVSAPAGANLKFEDYASQALLGATVLRVTCDVSGGHVVVERDEFNFQEHAGVVDVPIAAADCEKLSRRTSAALRCYGHARIDLFLDHTADGAAVVVDCGFVRREGPCATGS